MTVRLRLGVAVEEFFILKGDLQDSDGFCYKEGDFVSLASGSRHNSISPNGCIIVVTHRGKVIDLDDSDDLQSVGGTEEEGTEQQNRVEMHENALSRLITSCNEFTRTVTGTTDQHALVNFLDLPPGATNSRMPLSSVSSMSANLAPD